MVEHELHVLLAAVGYISGVRRDGARSANYSDLISRVEEHTGARHAVPIAVVDFDIFSTRLKF